MIIIIIILVVPTLFLTLTVKKEACSTYVVNEQCIHVHENDCRNLLHI